nr:pentatricopeptide repeat-containing protein [Tanacetum cinerariifolium]
MAKPSSLMNEILMLLHTLERLKDHITLNFLLLKKFINFFNSSVLTLTASSKAKRIESARATPKAHIPYGMFFTRLFRHVMEHHPHLENGIYDVVERFMRLLALRQAGRPRSDRGKARHSVSSTSAHHNRGSSSRQEDNDKDNGASRASTPSPTTYLNSLKPLNHQQYEIPSPSEQSDDLLFERQTKLLNQSQEIHKEVRGRFKSFRKAL